MAIETNLVPQTEDEIDLVKYISLFWHWAWLILLIGAVCGAAAFFLSRRMTPIYEASTTLLVNEAPANKITDYNSVLMSQKLTNTYSELMTTGTILQMASDQLGLSYPLETLKGMVSVTTLRDTQLMTVTVENQNAAEAAAIANMIAAEFTEYIQGIQTQRFMQSKEALEKQIAEIEAQINIYEIESDRALTLDEKESANEKIAQYRTINLGLQQSYEQIRLSEAQSGSSIVQVEPAFVNETPVKPKVLQNALIAFAAGCLLTMGYLFLREALDDTIKTPDEIAGMFDLPVLGVINHFKADEGSAITISEPRSPTAEAYRTLRTNIRYAGVDKPIRKLLIASVEPKEGKSTTACNLSVVMAQNGQNVILMDCDMRRPTLHAFFGLTNHRGISTLFSAPNENPVNMLQTTAVETLKVMTSGPLPPNPSELIGSQRMQAALSMICEYADMVIIDTPPALAVTDAAVLGPTLDGVLLVVRPGVTRRSGLRQAVAQFRQVNANLLGVVLNNIELQGKPYAYHYHYYNNYSAYQSYYGKKQGKGKADHDFKT